jgi:hypothetical protein
MMRSTANSPVATIAAIGSDFCQTAGQGSRIAVQPIATKATGNVGGAREAITCLTNA